jgi:hypothetical protein
MAAVIEELKAQMLLAGTPLEDHRDAYELLVKREDLSCHAPGPPFSKTRGVFARVAARDERVFGVLDTYHSQAGHAVARACQILGRRCINFYPEYKHEPGPRDPQHRARALGAELVGIPAGRSAILFHYARRTLSECYPDSYMMPNALKLEESVTETAAEVQCLGGLEPELVIVPSSSGTIAAGVIRGFLDKGGTFPQFVIHLGYSRSEGAVMRYLENKVGEGFPAERLVLVDEGYSYKDKARAGPTPPWPCNPYYDLKAFRWWMRSRLSKASLDTVLFWNIG